MIPAHAILKAEVRGGNGEINKYMFQRMLTIAKAAADMHECEFSYQIMGRSEDAPNDQELINIALAAMQETKEISSLPSASAPGDCGGTAGCPDWPPAR